MFTVRRKSETTVSALGTEDQAGRQRTWSALVDNGEIHIVENLVGTYICDVTRLSIPISDWELVKLLVDASKVEKEIMDKALAKRQG